MLETQLANSTTSSPTRLVDLHCQPELLLPARFTLTVPNAKITSFNCQIGSFDEGYEPNLAVLVTGDTTPIDLPELSDPFNRALDHQYRKLIRSGGLQDDKAPVLLFIAHEYSPSKIKGVDTLTLVLNPHLRGKGLGGTFIRNFENLIWEMGYDFTYGDNRETNYFDVFLHNGAVPTQRLRPETVQIGSPNYLGIERSDRRTIKFNPRFRQKHLYLAA